MMDLVDREMSQNEKRLEGATDEEERWTRSPKSHHRVTITWDGGWDEDTRSVFSFLISERKVECTRSQTWQVAV